MGGELSGEETHSTCGDKDLKEMNPEYSLEGLMLKLQYLAT